MNMNTFLFINFLVLITVVTGSPLEASCTVSNYNDVAAAVKSCKTLTLKDIQIPKETTMNLALQDGAKLIFDGHITHVPAEWTGDLIDIIGTNLEVSGTSSHLIDGLGPKHWKGGNEPKITRPTLIRLKLKNSTVKNLKIKNCPNHCVIIQSTDLVVSNILIDNKDGYPAKAGSKFAKNTDGFDISYSTNVKIENSVVYNQDDCVSILHGSGHVIDNLWCNGSHGLSLSVGGGDVSDIQFMNSHLEYSGSAIHIKTHNDGTTGHIHNVRYTNITFKDLTDKAINIQQNYPSGTAKGNVPITDLTFKDITGTMTGRKSEAKSIICAKGACSDWKWSNVKITGAKNKDVCQNVPSGVSC